MAYQIQNSDHSDRSYRDHTPISVTTTGGIGAILRRPNVDQSGTHTREAKLKSRQRNVARPQKREGGGRSVNTGRNGNRRHPTLLLRVVLSKEVNRNAKEICRSPIGTPR
jgi:hypothetical protein